MSARPILLVALACAAVSVALPGGLGAAAQSAQGGHARAADRNCSDFSSQRQAQEYFVSKGGPSSDPDRLDVDHDGIACESLPCPCSKSKGGGTRPPATKPQPQKPVFFHGRCKRGRHPDRSCTPGKVFRNVTAGEVCTPDYSQRVRNVSESTKQRIYLAYGIRRHASGSYEIDHLISLELGGSNSVKNLWPEKQPGARRLDVTENELHAEVCDGTITLSEAQRRIVDAKY